MVDFVGRSRSMLDDMQQWGQYFGEADNRSQNRWQQAEARRRYDEQNRNNRAGAISDSAFIGANQDAFDGMDPVLAGLRPQGAPAALATGAGTGPMSLSPTGATQAPVAAAAAAAPVAGLQGSNEPAFDVNQITPVILGQLSRPQRQAWDTYLRAVRSASANPETARPTVSAERELAARTRLQAAGLDIRNGRLVRTNPNYSMEALRFPTGTAEEAASPAVDPNADLAAPAAGLNAPALSGAPFLDAGTPTPGLDPYYQGANDTSRGLQPTREMRLLQVSVQDNMRRAELAAAHGQREVAQQAFGQALQGQAAYLQQGRMVMYRAASGGSLDAMSSLLEEFHGYPPGSVRLQPTDEQRTRFNLQVQNDAGQWVSASEVPRTRDEIMGGLLNLIDAEGAAARTEANTELMRANIAAGADIQVATIGQRTAILRMIADTQIAQMNNQARAQLQSGQGELTLDAENGVAWFQYQTADSEGNPIRALEMIRLEDQPGPSTNGRSETVQVPTRTRVTGVAGVGTN